MTTTLQRKDHDDIPETAFLRPRRPQDHKQFAEILPWCTPLFTYQMSGCDWIRWSIPKTVGPRFGLALDGECDCCGKQSVVGGVDDFHFDTSWPETGWWLTDNGYALPEATPEDVPPVSPLQDPTKSEEGDPS